jgi:NAD(P)-dependent dehydrogenase (short-subunit alcohol dehydrogenase family)
MNHEFSMSGMNILVTGASSGIGRCTAIRLSLMGANVTICSRNLKGLEETLALMEGERHEIMVADFSKSVDLNNLVISLKEIHGLVHCVGTHKFVLSKFISEPEINEILKVNFISPVLLTKELVRAKKIKKGGSIIFVSSIAANSPSVGTILYGTSKAAVNSAMRSFALELAPLKIRVNSVSPGIIKTDFLFKNNESLSRTQLSEDEARYPLGYGIPEDITNAIIFLLSDGSRWITGSDLIIDGGISLKNS